MRSFVSVVIILAFGMISYGLTLPVYKDAQLANELRTSSYESLKTNGESGLFAWYDKMEENRTIRWWLIDSGTWLLMFLASVYVFKRWFKVQSWKDLRSISVPRKRRSLIGLSVFVPWFVYFGLIHVITYNQIRDFYHPHADTIFILYVYLGVLALIGTAYLLFITGIISYLKQGDVNLWVWSKDKKWRSRIWLIHTLIQLVPVVFLLLSSLFYLHLRGAVFLIPATMMWAYLVLCWRAQLTCK